jgi:hypothetical protein
METLKLSDMSDRELLLAMLDVAGPDGFVDRHDVAEHLGMKPDGHGPRSVSVRLAWMARWGTVERELLWDDNGNAIMNRAGTQQRVGQRWKLTAKGLAIASGALKKSQENALEGMDEATMLLIVQRVARSSIEGGTAAEALIRREWNYRTHFRRNGQAR